MSSTVFYGHLNDAIRRSIRRRMTHSKMDNFRKMLLHESNRLPLCGSCRRLRQLAERSDYFRSELRSMHHQTWFLPNDQAFASMGSSLSFLLDQFSINNTNDINEVTHASLFDLHQRRSPPSNALVHPSSCRSNGALSSLDGFNATGDHVER